MKTESRQEHGFRHYTAHCTSPALNGKIGTQPGPCPRYDTNVRSTPMLAQTRVRGYLTPPHSGVSLPHIRCVRLLYSIPWYGIISTDPACGNLLGPRMSRCGAYTPPDLAGRAGHEDRFQQGRRWRTNLTR